MGYFIKSIQGAKGILEVLELFLIYTLFISLNARILRPIVVAKVKLDNLSCSVSPLLPHLLFVKYAVN